MTVATSQAPITFCDAAANKVRSLMESEGNDELMLRVFVTGGGCSGFQYGFTFDDAMAEDDTRIDHDGVTMLVDPMSFPYLQGSEVDYEESLMGSRFLVRNPSAKTTCGCGSSFSI